MEDPKRTIALTENIHVEPGDVLTKKKKKFSRQTDTDHCCDQLCKHVSTQTFFSPLCSDITHQSEQSETDQEIIWHYLYDDTPLQEKKK